MRGCDALQFKRSLRAVLSGSLLLLTLCICKKSVGVTTEAIRPSLSRLLALLHAYVMLAA